MAINCVKVNCGEVQASMQKNTLLHSSLFLLCEFIYPLFLFIPSHHVEGITVYLYFLWLSAHLSFLLSVSCQSLCLHALPDKSKTPSPLWVCACPFLRVYVSLCAVWWQWVTVSNGPDLEVGMHLLCMCLCVCVGARQIVLCACVCVCVCAFVLWWWQLRGNWEVQCSVPSWCPCHFLALFPSLNFP